MTFQVGDRVAVYEVLRTELNPKYILGRRKGTIIAINTAEALEVLFDANAADCMHGYSYHPKQCRRLKPKKKSVIWLALTIGFNSGDNFIYTDEYIQRTPGVNKANFIRFIEAPEKKK